MKPKSVRNDAGQNGDANSQVRIEFSSRAKRSRRQLARQRRERQTHLLDENHQEHECQSVINEKLACMAHKFSSVLLVQF